MKLPRLTPAILPWFKATSGQWRYALRNTIAMCLALTFAYYLNLDEPYWAMTSAAVVSFPTVGGVISKSLGRIAGSLLGATAALIIAGHTLNEPWLFLLSMSVWIGFCTWACAHFTNNVAYAFQLAGYTAAIIAFPMVHITEVTQLWDIAQARVCEVIVGILCGGLMMMILPSTSDGTTLLTALKNMHARLLEHASLLWQPETTDAIRTAHEGVIGQILTMNLLRIQAFWSHYRFRRQNTLLNALLHQQLRLTSVISSLRRMLLNWPNPPANTRNVIEQLLNALVKPDTDSYAVARIIAPLCPVDQHDYRHVAFWQRLRYFCCIYLKSSHYLRLLEKGVTVDNINIERTPGLARHTDNAEALWSGLRTFITLMAIGAWSIGAQWESGSGALTLAAISCVLLFRRSSPLQITLFADAHAGPAVAVQFCGEIRSDGTNYRSLAVHSVSLPTACHHAVVKITDAETGRALGTADRLYGIVHRGDQSSRL